MSYQSEDNFVPVGSDSFWEPGNYKRTTKRIEDGNKLCVELMVFVSERAEIEKSYARHLKTWAAKWNNIIEKGPEYGTMEASWKAILVEADRRCDLHNQVSEDLHMNVNSQLKLWQKDNYHKSMMNLKEKREMDEQFKKAQKPWAKLLQKVNKTKADYHIACKNEKSAKNLERNAIADTSLSQDQHKKLQDRVSKAKDQVSKCHDSYETSLHDLNNYNAKYMEDMTDVFEKCQQMEARRLRCFKEILFAAQKCLNISDDPLLPQIYEEFYHTINNSDHKKDLLWWSNTHGVNMLMNWPQFEEYTEEFRDIAGSKTKKSQTGTIGDGSITLINQRHVGDDLPEYPQRRVGKISGPDRIRDNCNGSNNKINQQHSFKNSCIATAIGGGSASRQHSDNRNGVDHTGGGCGPSFDRSQFEEEEWDEYGYHDDPLMDNGEPGVKVRALYDYEAAESDELDFKAGDTFEKLEDEDEQGWCKGRKDGKVGLYPANYIEVI